MNKKLIAEIINTSKVIAEKYNVYGSVLTMKNYKNGVVVIFGDEELALDIALSSNKKNAKK